MCTSYEQKFIYDNIIPHIACIFSGMPNQLHYEPQPYGPWGSFLRGGPAPFLVRTLNANDYDQAVFKYMAQTSCSRIEAQGNMDAFFNNGADWAYQKSEEARLVCFNVHTNKNLYTTIS